MFLNNLFEVPHDRFVFDFAATLEGGVIPLAYGLYGTLAGAAVEMRTCQF